MPYLPPNIQKRQQQVAAPTLGGSAPTMAVGSSGTASPAAPAPVSTGSGWTNLQDYLSANSPTLEAQGAQTAADLTGKAQSALTTANGTALYGVPSASGALTPNTSQWAAPSENPLFTDTNKQQAGEALQGVQDFTAPTGGLDAWLRSASGATGQVQAVGDKYGDALRAVQGYQWNKATPPVVTPAEGAGQGGVPSAGPYTNPTADQGGHGGRGAPAKGAPTPSGGPPPGTPYPTPLDNGPQVYGPNGDPTPKPSTLGEGLPPVPGKRSRNGVALANWLGVM